MARRLSLLRVLKCFIPGNGQDTSIQFLIFVHIKKCCQYVDLKANLNSSLYAQLILLTTLINSHLSRHRI